MPFVEGQGFCISICFCLAVHKNKTRSTDTNLGGTQFLLLVIVVIPFFRDSAKHSFFPA